MEAPVEPEEEGPAEILDLDDEEVPLAGADNLQGNENDAAEENDTGVNWLLVAVCILVVVVGGLVALWYIKRRRKQEDKEEENE